MLLAGSHWNLVVCGYSARNLTQQGAPMRPLHLFITILIVLTLSACAQPDLTEDVDTTIHENRDAPVPVEAPRPVRSNLSDTSPTPMLVPSTHPHSTTVMVVPDPTGTTRPVSASPTSGRGFSVSPEGASNPSSDGSAADFELKEFPHFPIGAIVRISTPVGTGSGFIFLTREDTAFVMTNAHVVDGQPSITVRVRNADEYDAVLLGGDHIVDIAVLSVCCSDSFEEVPLWEGLKITNLVPWSDNTDSAWTGDPLVVVGYPRGSYDLVATSGEIQTTIETRAGLRVVHDAIAEPGSSGSPVLSPDGRLMGVHFAGSIWGEENSFFVPFDEAEYYSAQWLPRTDPAAAVVPVHQADVTIRFTNKGTALLAAAASRVHVPDRTLEIEMVPDESGWTWTMYNRGAMNDSQMFYNLVNSAPKWNHIDVRADSFTASLSEDVFLECERSPLSDDWASLFTCRNPSSSRLVIPKARVHIMPNSFSPSVEAGSLALIVNTTFDVGPNELRINFRDKKFMHKGEKELWWLMPTFPLVGSRSLDENLTYSILRAPDGRKPVLEDIEVLTVEHRGLLLECDPESLGARNRYWICE